MTAPPAPDALPVDESPSRRRTYVAVILVEVIVLIALWLFQTHFGR